MEKEKNGLQTLFYLVVGNQFPPCNFFVVVVVNTVDVPTSVNLSLDENNAVVLFHKLSFELVAVLTPALSTSSPTGTVDSLLFNTVNWLMCRVFMVKRKKEGTNLYLSIWAVSAVLHRNKDKLTCLGTLRKPYRNRPPLLERCRYAALQITPGNYIILKGLGVRT